MSNRPHKKKVSLVINTEDVTNIYSSQMTPGQNGKAMEMPAAHYAAYPYDTILNKQGDMVGISTYSAFLAPDGAWVGLAIVDESQSTEGNELTIVWGEPDGGSNRPPVEKHVQMELRATVSGWPFSKVAQLGYRPE